MAALCGPVEAREGTELARFYLRIARFSESFSLKNHDLGGYPMGSSRPGRGPNSLEFLSIRVLSMLESQRLSQEDHYWKLTSVFI